MIVATTSGRWITSVRGWLGGSLAMLCAFLAGASGFTLYELDLRKHDYQILNLSGQMRVLAASFEQQANDVLMGSIRDGGAVLVVAAVQGLAKLAESRDPETGNHLIRMSLYSAFIAEELGTRPAHRDLIDPGYVRSLHRFAPMHDIGKVGIADRVLLKPGRLDDGERLEMNKHPLIGAEVLRLCEQRMNELGRSVFQVGIEIAESHHEKWDGSGYPHGLTGAAIPLSARIVAVADVFDALTSKRPYKDAFSVEKALDIIHQDAGSHFDPEVVDALDLVMPRVLDVYDRLKHI
jgi:response regulator RpfG family c-di-GMP phosphodiesterase